MTMQPINCWNDASQFAGKVVAYHTTSDYFGAKRCYTFDDKSTYFGVIDEKTSKFNTGEIAFCMSKLLKAKEKASFCAIILSNISSPLTMRLATTHEVEQIQKVIISEEAYFAFIFTKESMLKALTSQLPKMSKL